MIAMRECLQKEHRDRKSKERLNRTLEARIFPLLDARVNTPGIRSYFVQTFFQYIREQAKKEHTALGYYEEHWFDTHLPYIAENIISIQYYENVILDGKGGLLKRTPQNMEGEYDRVKLQDRLIGSHYVKDRLYDYIDDCIFDKDDYARISMTQKAVRRMFKYVDLGQLVQAQYGTFEYFLQASPANFHIQPDVDAFIPKDIIDAFGKVILKEGMPVQYKTFTEGYLHRIALTSAALFVIMADLIMDILDYHGKERENCRKFAFLHGMIGQIVNDINDFTPSEAGLSTACKNPQDAFSDLLNNNVTLPLIFYFAQHPDTKLCNLRNLWPDSSLILEEMRDSLAFAQAVAIRMDKYATQFLNTCNDFANPLLDMNNIAYSEENRFFKAIASYCGISPSMSNTIRSGVEKKTPVSAHHINDPDQEQVSMSSSEARRNYTGKNRGNATEINLLDVIGISDQKDNKFRSTPICADCF